MPETAEQERKRSLGPWWLCGATTPAPALDSESHVVSKGKKNPNYFVWPPQVWFLLLASATHPLGHRMLRKRRKKTPSQILEGSLTQDSFIRAVFSDVHVTTRFVKAHERTEVLLIICKGN